MKLTEPRKRALAVLLAAERKGGPNHGHIVRSSSVTALGRVYWRVANWLVDEGLARWRDGLCSDLVLTDRGRAVAEWEDGR